MNRTVIVSLIQKNIDELILLTQGFMEMNEYPRPILDLAQHKTEDISAYIQMLRELKTRAEGGVSETGGDEERKTSTAINENISANVVAQDVGKTIIDDSDAVPVNAADLTEEEVNEVKEAEEQKAGDVAHEEIQHEVEEEDAVDVEETEIENVVFEDELNEVEEEEEEVEEDEVTEDEYTNDAIEEMKTEISTDSTLSYTNLQLTETQHASKITTLGEKMSSGSLSRNDTMARENNGINASIANKKIEDIRQAISLGDRFRFQRELFRNNGEDMNKTLSYINLLATYEEVVSFLQSKYAWTDDNIAAKDFYQIIRRKF